MSRISTFVYICATIFGCLVVSVGCDKKQPSADVPSSASKATLEQIYQLAAEQLFVDRSQLRPSTSLGELGADELDFVELVLELEDHFSIAIPDEVARRMMGTDDWQQGMKNVTMEKLAIFIDQEQRRTAMSGAMKSIVAQQLDASSRDTNDAGIAQPPQRETEQSQAPDRRK